MSISGVRVITLVAAALLSASVFERSGPVEIRRPSDDQTPEPLDLKDDRRKVSAEEKRRRRRELRRVIGRKARLA